MHTMSSSTGPAMGDWKLAIAGGFVALTVLGAAVDDRNALADTSVSRLRSGERSVALPTNREMLQEMLAHD